MRSIKLIGFDLDGTLVKMKLDFNVIREELGIEGRDTLGHIMSQSEEERDRLMGLLEQKELSAAENAEAAPGAKELLSYCREKEMGIVVITRNSEEASKRTLEILGLEYDMLISREDAKPKPSPESINIVLSQYKIEPHEMVFVGDYIYDLQAGNAAGVKTILIATQERADDWAPKANYVAQDLFEVLDILREGKDINRC